MDSPGSKPYIFDAIMIAAEIIGLALVVILSAVLYYRHWQRVIHEIDPRAEREWTGKGFDTSGIAPQIKTVRNNYRAKMQPSETHFRRGILAFARQAVSHLPFFEDRPEHGPNAHPH
jgi:hypothetical protein